MKENAIPQRLAALREEMKKNNISAMIIPTDDAHMSEYVADYWKCREWISGFTGSAGKVVVTLNWSGLWSDSRYFIQAPEQLEGSTMRFYKEMLAETPSIEQEIIKDLKPGDKVAIDGSLFSVNAANNYKKYFAKHGIELVNDFRPFDIIWKDRPSIPSDQAFVFPEEFSGESADSKCNRILQEIDKYDCNATIISTLDDIAWTMNIRGTDVAYNPVVTSYLYVSGSERVLFVEPEKITTEVMDYLKQNNIIVSPYSNVLSYLKKLNNDVKILIDPARVNSLIDLSVNEGVEKVYEASPVPLMKSLKNETEIEGFRKAMIEDGIALVKFYRWLEENIDNGSVNEISVSDKLVELREAQEGCIGPSFGTICGFHAHAAMCHYSATEESNATVTNQGILLIDSGGQYFGGTTDITRTTALGTPTAEEKRCFTLVLKGHIGLSKAVFPEGTRGDQIDILARKALWENGLNYLHGTGHGTGHCLNVHEGPQSIRTQHNPVTIQLGMVNTNEPGLYLTGKFGIRHENQMLVVEDKSLNGEFGKFFKFEPLTLCHFDTNGIDISLMTKEEIDWLNDYHKMVYDKLESRLSEEEKAWLKNKTQPLNY